MFASMSLAGVRLLSDFVAIHSFCPISPGAPNMRT